MSGLPESVLRIVREGGSGMDLFEAYGASKRQEEAERCARFEPLGVGADCPWPAARVFHEHSKLTPAFWPKLTAMQAEELTLNLDYKRYPDAPRLELPRQGPLAVPLEAAIARRRSVRSFSPEPLELEQLAKLLELSCGVTGRDTSVPHRAYPSGGALYPIEVYPIALSVRDVSPAVYHYATLEHALERVRPIAGLKDLKRAVPELVSQAKPALVIVLTQIFARSNSKYGERGYRFGLLEAGHIAQNVVLVASALGLDTVCLGGFFDDDTNRVLSLDEQTEAAVYGVLVGRGA